MLFFVVLLLWFFLGGEWGYKITPCWRWLFAHLFKINCNAQDAQGGPFKFCSLSLIHFPFILSSYTCYCVVCQPLRMIDQQRDQELEDISLIPTDQHHYTVNYWKPEKGWMKHNNEKHREKKFDKYLLLTLRSKKIT